MHYLHWKAKSQPLGLQGSPCLFLFLVMSLLLPNFWGIVNRFIQTEYLFFCGWSLSPSWNISLITSNSCLKVYLSAVSITMSGLFWWALHAIPFHTFLLSTFPLCILVFKVNVVSGIWFYFSILVFQPLAFNQKTTTFCISWN